MSELAKENLATSQQRQKRWYDQKAKKTSFEVGDKVLVLLPTYTSKLLAQWQGPFVITRKIGDVDYEVELSGRRKNLKILHVNMLRKWYPLSAMDLLAEEVAATSKEDIITWKDQSVDGANPVIGTGLNTEQSEELQDLLESFADMVRDKPVGGTSNFNEEYCQSHTTTSLSDSSRSGKNGTG